MTGRRPPAWAGRLMLLAGAALFAVTLWFVVAVVGAWVDGLLPPEGGLLRAEVRDCLAHQDGEAPSVTGCGEADARYHVSAAVTDPLHCYRIPGAAAVLRVERQVLCLTEGSPSAGDESGRRSGAGVRAGFCRADADPSGWSTSCGGGHRAALLVFRTEDTTDPVAQCHARGAAGTELAETTRLRDLTEPPGRELAHTQVVCAGPVLELG